MRLGINARFLAAPVTGVQRFAHEVVRRICRRAGVDVTIFVPRGVQVPADIAGSSVAGALRGQLWEQFELPHLAAHCDVVLHPANTAPLRRHGPYVLVLHDVLPLTDAAWFGHAFALWGRLMTPRAARGAARIVTVSEWSRRAIRSATGIATDRIRVAPQGLAPFTAPASAAEVSQVRTRFALPPRFVLAVGDDARKNVEFLVRMIERWHDVSADAPALVVTGAPQRRVHGAYSARRNGSRHVITLGHVTDAELRALYTAADVLCAASHAEGLGRAPLEAIGCGTPAVVAPFGPAAETLPVVASARVVPLTVDAWLAAIQELEAVPAAVRKADAAKLHERWTWDAAADVVHDACSAAFRDRAQLRARPVAVTTLAAVTHRTTDRAGRGSASSTLDGAVPLRVALVHDWLTGTRGGERVLEALVDLFPDADLFTLIHVPGSAPAAVEALRIRTSAIDALPGVRHYYRYCLPLFPAAIERFDLSGYDLIVSSSHCVAKSVNPAGARHLCYCHTPMRYAWDQRDAYLGTGPGGVLRRAALSPVLEHLRRWDASTADRVDTFIANSDHVRRRIRDCYGRDALVVHPPVDIDRFAPARRRDDVYLCAGALVPYKRIDIAVAAFNSSGRRLIVAGDGPAYRSLRRIARSNIEFTGRVSDEEVACLLGRARGLVMPMVEDFGIVAVEAQAAGTPVIAYGAGGVLESVVHGVTGVHFHSQTPAALAAAVNDAERFTFDVGTLRGNAARFDRHAFRAGMRAALADVMTDTVTASCT